MTSEPRAVNSELAPAYRPRSRPTGEALLLLSPRILFGVAIAILSSGIVKQGVYGTGDARWEALSLLLIYLSWLLVEVSVTFRRAAAPPADSKTLLPYALARLGVLAAAAFARLPWDAWQVWMLAPAALFVTGVSVRQIAIRRLGRFYSHHVMRQQDHAVVTSGLYRVVRHPAYAGMLTAHIGFVAFFLNPFSVVALLLLAMAIIWRIRVEERTLWAVPGYAAYATGKARLLPGVW